MSAMTAAARVFPAQRIALCARDVFPQATTCHEWPGTPAGHAAISACAVGVCPAHVADVRAAGEKALAGVEREEEVVHGLGHIL